MESAQNSPKLTNQENLKVVALYFGMMELLEQVTMQLVNLKVSAEWCGKTAIFTKVSMSMIEKKDKAVL